MEISPQDQRIIFGTPQEVTAKFNEYGMLDFLKKTCKPHKIKLDTKTRADRRYTSLHAENWLRNSDGGSQAIMCWWRTLDGGEDYIIEQFTAPDGDFHSIDIQHPSKFSK
jgi:hypothetical protein